MGRQRGSCRIHRIADQLKAVLIGHIGFESVISSLRGGDLGILTNDPISITLNAVIEYVINSDHPPVGRASNAILSPKRIRISLSSV